MAIKISEELKKKLGEETVKALEEAYKDVDVVLEPQANFIPKARLDEVSTQLKEQKAANDTINSKLEEALKTASTAEDYKAKLEAAQNEMKAANEKHLADIASREKTYLVNDALREAQAKNPKAIMGLIDLDKVNVVDGKLDGFNTQIDELKKSDAYLFGESSPQDPPQPKVDRFGNPIVPDPGDPNANSAKNIAAGYLGVNPDQIK